MKLGIKICPNINAHTTDHKSNWVPSNFRPRNHLPKEKLTSGCLLPTPLPDQEKLTLVPLYLNPLLPQHRKNTQVTWYSATTLLATETH
jgi:hypothetical protein